ncbi:tetrachloroethene dehalogenase [Photobacterium sagamiensis]|uniref:tetrachloroethene dehalogenase n=1 Tax=Photobacterium sagamiensis TaxID=2910241 RepID=UPI003D0F010C
MIGLMWYLLGMLTTAGIWGYVKLKEHYRIDWRANLGLMASAGSAWFCVAWSWASFAEREPQSGAMGLIMFGLIGLVIFAGTWRLFITPANK